MIAMARELEDFKLKQETSSQPTPTPPAKASLELQSKCAAQSKVFFDQWLRDTPDYRKPDIGKTFTSHYDPAANSCYVEIIVAGIRIGNEFATSKFVSDAYEGSSLAEYYWMSRTGRKYWEVKPTMCSVKSHDGKTNYCDSDEIYQQMVRDTYGVNE
jgi:hypothetical protein